MFSKLPRIRHLSTPFICFLWHLRGTAFASCYFCKHATLQVFFFSFFRLLEINPQRHARPGIGTASFSVVSERLRVNVDIFFWRGGVGVSENIAIKKRHLVVRSAGLQEAPEFTGRQASCIRASPHPPPPRGLHLVASAPRGETKVDVGWIVVFAALPKTLSDISLRDGGVNAGYPKTPEGKLHIFQTDRIFLKEKKNCLSKSQQKTSVESSGFECCVSRRTVTLVFVLRPLPPPPPKMQGSAAPTAGSRRARPRA